VTVNGSPATVGGGGGGAGGGAGGGELGGGELGGDELGDGATCKHTFHPDCELPAALPSSELHRYLCPEDTEPAGGPLVPQYFGEEAGSPTDNQSPQPPEA